MKTSLLASILASALIAGVANAAPIEIDVPRNVQPPESTVTRAEVIADYHMWRLAGLKALNDDGDRPLDTNSDQYRRAFATYVQLLSSPQFATLVRELQDHPNAIVVARAPSGRFAKN